MGNNYQNPFKNLAAEKPSSLVELSELIEKRRYKLTDYAKRSDARQGYVSSENEHLSTLAGIHDELALLRHSGIWQAVEQDLIRLNQSDNFLNAYQLNFNLKPNNHVPGVLTYNLY